MLTVGHQKQKEFLKKSQLLGKVPSALLFVGKDGVGKKLLALEFARGLLCKKNKPFGCGECKSCLQVNRFIEAITKGEEEAFAYHVQGEDGKKHFAYLVGDHPDLAVVVPDGNQIKIDQIRELKEFVSLKPVGDYKIVIIDRAGKMNVQAQNALLKTLEEPPPGTVFILIAGGRGELLPTIVSRCQVLEFKPLKPFEVEEVLKRLEVQVPPSVKKLLLEEGSLSFLNLEEEKVWDLIGRIENFENLSWEEVVKLSEEAEKLELEQKETLLGLLEKLLTAKVVNGSLNLELYEKVSPLLEELKQGLKRGLKFKLALENLLFTLKGI